MIWFLPTISVANSRAALMFDPDLPLSYAKRYRRGSVFKRLSFLARVFCTPKRIFGAFDDGAHHVPSVTGSASRSATRASIHA